MDYAELERYAFENGAFDAKTVLSSDIVVDDRVRLKCQIPFCDAFNHYLECPPNTLSTDEFRKILSLYQKVLLVQVRTEPFSKLSTSERMTHTTTTETEALVKEKMNRVEEDDIVAAEKKLHQLVNKLESKAMMMGAYSATGFKASKCRLCDDCVGVASGKKCRHPYLARPSMEGVGVDVYATCRTLGLKMDPFAQDAVVYTGMILLD